MVTMQLLQFQPSHPLSSQEEGDRVMLAMSVFPVFPFPADFSLFHGLELGHVTTVSTRDSEKHETGVS